MHTPRKYSVPALLTLVLLSLVGLTGCSDNPLGVEKPAVEAEVNQAQNKFRNAHLYESALKPSEHAGKFGNQAVLNLVFALDAQGILERYGVLERYAVLERYRVLERYHILERYDYLSTFPGFAISVEDSLGLSEYDDFLTEMANDPDILWFEPDFAVDMPNPDAGDGASGQSVPWSVAAVGGQSSWTVSGDGSGSVDVDVYVLDSGVATGDPNNSGDDLNLFESIDFRTGSSDSRDYMGHGTHIAGIIGAQDDSDGLVGIAPNAKIHSLKVLDDTGTTDVSVVIAAVEYITNEKLANPSVPVVVNMSIGENIGTPDFSALDYALEASIDAGVIYVVAAGNQGEDAAHVTPAKVPGAITVGSYNGLGVFSAFSNWGSTLDLLAPGEGVVSLGTTNGLPVVMSGTSMSTAHVTGAAALYLAQYPGASPGEVSDFLKATAQDYVVGAPSGTTNLSVWVGQVETGTVDVRTTHDSDDVEERLSDGDMDHRSDLELAVDGSKPQLVGLRFGGIDIPQGAIITSAYIQFTARHSDSGATDLVLRAHAHDDAPALGWSDYGLSERSQTLASETWAPAPWTSSGASGLDQRTPDLSAIVQELVSRSGWSAGNSLVVLVSGSGDRTAESYDTSSNEAPELHVEWTSGGVPPVAPPPAPPSDPTTEPSSQDLQVSSSADDAEQLGSGGWMSLGSDDLELGVKNGNEQVIGLRFQGVSIPQGATVTSAHIQFTAQGSNSDTANFSVAGQDADDANAFGGNQHDISNRPQTSATIAWPVAAWSYGDSGADERSPDLSAVIQEIVNRGGWSSGNDLVLMVSGSGFRKAYSYDDSSSKAPKFHIEWQ